MKKSALLIALLFCTLCAAAQPVVGSSELARDLYKKANTYLAQKDFPNAVLVYNQLARLEPKNLIYRRELAYTYFRAGDMPRATKVIVPLLKAKEADESTFLTASKIFTSRKMIGDAFDAVDRGIKKFPNSGMLYSDLGTLYTMRKKYDKAVEAWEKGVKVEPTFHMNYYNLTKSYFVSKRPLWAIVYGETFVNMERYSVRTQEIKRILFDSYKKLISNNQLNAFESNAQLKRLYRGKSKFELSALKAYNKLSNLVLGGVDMDNITMLRTRFLLEWSNTMRADYPLALFNYTNEIIEQGHFPAYNQWLFGKADNEKRYTEWAITNSKELNSFEQFFRLNKFQPKKGQYYK